MHVAFRKKFVKLETEKMSTFVSHYKKARSAGMLNELDDTTDSAASDIDREEASEEHFLEGLEQPEEEEPEHDEEVEDEEPEHAQQPADEAGR